MSEIATQSGAQSDDRPVRVEFPARPRSMTDGAVVDGPEIAGVGLVLLDRPKALNALNAALLEALVVELRKLDADPACRCIVIAGAGDRAFAAGADIREMIDETPANLALNDRFARWDEVAQITTPLIAAVRGFALGGGLELALICDLLIAGDDAVFGQPEIRIGLIPGAGGTQRLTRAIGKARAMELILTGRQVRADEAEKLGFVTEVVAAGETIHYALDTAAQIAGMPPLAVRAAVAAVRNADRLALDQGIAAERKAFHALFGTEDQREGMTAFLEKRAPKWKGR